MGINMNYGGIRRQDHVNVRQILFDVKHQTSVSVRIADTGLSNDANGKKYILAGTPLSGNLLKRSTPFKKATITDTGVKGVYTVQITTPFENGEKIIIEGTTYEHAAAEDISAKKFTGADAAAQITSLLKMVVTDDFDVAAVQGSTDKLGFTQKVAETDHPPVVTKDGSTGVIGAVTQVIAGDTGDVTHDGVGLLLHDVDLTNDEEVNGTLLIWGFVNLDRMDPAVVDILSLPVQEGLPKITFLRDH